MSKPDKESSTNRLFACDLVRIFAMICVFTSHYCLAAVVEKGTMTGFAVMAGRISLGQQGVGLFVVLAGMMSALSYERIQQKNPGASLKQMVLTYYVKRLKSIYPLFWVAYIIMFYHIMTPAGVTPLRPVILASLFGFDGYLLVSGVQTVYLVGEWYIGAIVILYLLFPLVYAFIRRYPVPTAVVLVVLYFGGVYLYPFTRLKETLAFFRLLPFSAGIYLWLYLRRPGHIFAVVAGVVLILSMVIKCPDYMYNAAFQETSSFIVLLYLGNLLDQVKGKRMDIVRRIITFIAAYSYMFFLFHHQVIYDVLAPYTPGSRSVLFYILAYAYSFVLVFVISVILTGGGEYVMGLPKKLRGKK